MGGMITTKDQLEYKGLIKICLCDKSIDFGLSNT